MLSTKSGCNGNITMHYSLQQSVLQQSLNMATDAGMQQLQPNAHDDGWSRVGSKGRHRHVPNTRGNAFLAGVAMIPKDNQSAHAPAPSPDSTPTDYSFSLISLPAIALASIFHHLDSISSYQLAQTCRLCASEFTLQKSDLPRKCRSEYLPVVTRTPATQQQPYGRSGDPIILQLEWKEPCALSKIHALSSQPCFMWDLWRHAWPESLWSDLLADGLPEVRSSLFLENNIVWSRQLYVKVVSDVTSDEPMQLPWTWLADCVVRGSATALMHYLKSKFGDVSHDFIDLRVSLFRPAKAGHFHLIMRKKFGYHDVGAWYTDDDTCSVHTTWRSDIGVTYRTPLCLQKVAITGNWCPDLPDAFGLWEAHCGDEFVALSAFTFGDQVEVGIGEDWYYGFRGYEDDACSYQFDSSSDEEEFDHIDGGLEQPNWKFKRQEAKVKGNIKRCKAARRKGKTASKQQPKPL